MKSANTYEQPLSNQAPVPNKGVMEISAYVPGREKAEGAVKVYKLSSNETPLGPSPHARDAARHATENLAIYPDGSSTALRDAIARHYGLNAANLICANGSDELLGLIAQIYLGAGDEGIFTEHGFLVYKIQILAAGATPVMVKETDETANADAILAAVTPKTKVVFLANPNNPTGTYMPVQDVRRLHAGLPSHVLLVLDAAYAEYVRRNDYEAGIELVSSSKNVVMTRTFSKIHGLAALRLGWLYGPAEICDAINRVRGPFNVNAIALAAGISAIADNAHVEKAIAHNNFWLERLTNAFEQMGLRVTPSVGNFLLIHFPDDVKINADAADLYLAKRGYLLRAVKGYGFPNALRMSVGTEEANEGVIAALKAFFDGA